VGRFGLDGELKSTPYRKNNDEQKDLPLLWAWDSKYFSVRKHLGKHQISYGTLECAVGRLGEAQSFGKTKTTQAFYTCRPARARNRKQSTRKTYGFGPEYRLLTPKIHSVTDPCSTNQEDKKIRQGLSLKDKMDLAMVLFLLVSPYQKLSDDLINVRWTKIDSQELPCAACPRIAGETTDEFARSVDVAGFRLR
jgi:hypothetical protein